MSQLLLLESMGVNPLDPSSDYGASLGQPFNNDDAATQKFCSDCSESSNDEDMAAAEEALDAIAQAETQVADDYDAAEEQAGVESCLTFMLESQVPPARQLLPHTKRGQGPAEHALLSDPASPSYSPVASPDDSRPAPPEAEAEPPASPSYSPVDSSPSYSPVDSPADSPQASPR